MRSGNSFRIRYNLGKIYHKTQKLRYGNSGTFLTSVKRPKMCQQSKISKFRYNFWHFWSNFSSDFQLNFWSNFWSNFWPFRCFWGIFWIFLALFSRHMWKMSKNNRRFLTDTVDFWKFHYIFDIIPTYVDSFKSFGRTFTKVETKKSCIIFQRFLTVGKSVNV